MDKLQQLIKSMRQITPSAINYKMVPTYCNNQRQVITTSNIMKRKPGSGHLVRHMARKWIRAFLQLAGPTQGFQGSTDMHLMHDSQSCVI